MCVVVSERLAVPRFEAALRQPGCVDLRRARLCAFPRKPPKPDGELMADATRRRYVRRADRPVAAVRLALNTDGLVYQKWGGEQRAKPGDWIVDNDGDVYSVDADVFARTYRQTATGAYVKTTPVWA